MKLQPKTDERLYFSCIYGTNYYALYEDGGSVCRARHRADGTEVTFRPDNDLAYLRRLQKMIELPPRVGHIFWPCDVVEMEMRRALVFPRRGLPPLQSLKQILYNENMLGAEKPFMPALISRFLSVCEDLEDAAYCYNDYNPDKMFYDPETYDVYFDFSLAVSTPAETFAFPDCAEVFLAPWVDLEKKDTLTSESNRYSVAAVLFRLLIGRMPYQGANMDTYPWFLKRADDSVDVSIRRNMFRHYFSCPIFIFEGKEENAIGVLGSESKFIERWERLPAPLRDAFSACFCSENVSAAQKTAYSPRQWRALLEEAKII